MSSEEEVLGFGICPTCGLPCQYLPDGPQGFPFHDCDWVLALKAGKGGTKDPAAALLESVSASVSSRAASMPGRDIGEVLQGLAAVMKAQGVGSGNSGQELLEWLREPIDESDPLEGEGEHEQGQEPRETEDPAPVEQEERPPDPPKRRKRRSAGEPGRSARKTVPWPGADR